MTVARRFVLVFALRHYALKSTCKHIPYSTVWSCCECAQRCRAVHSACVAIVHLFCHDRRLADYIPAGQLALTCRASK